MGFEIKLHQRYQQIVDKDLETTILKNFDFFNKAFENFECIKEDMREVRDSSRSMMGGTRQLKMNQLANLVKIYRLQRKKQNIARVCEVLSYITVIKQSLPVIENLITSSDSLPNLSMSLDLIANAKELLSSKLKGIDVCQVYARKLGYLRNSCVDRMQKKTN